MWSGARGAGGSWKEEGGCGASEGEKGRNVESEERGEENP